MNAGKGSWCPNNVHVVQTNTRMQANALCVPVNNGGSTHHVSVHEHGSMHKYVCERVRVLNMFRRMNMEVCIQCVRMLCECVRLIIMFRRMNMGVCIKMGAKAMPLRASAHHKTWKYV